MNKRSDSIMLAEQRVTESCMAVLAEYQAARVKLHRRISSPVFIGGALFVAIALGYLTLGRGPKRFIRPEAPAQYCEWAR